MKSQELIIYRNLQHRELFDHVSTLLAVGPDDKPGTMPDSYACASQLIDMAVTYGFEGNLWHCFLAFCLANNENVYSTSCEIVGHIEGSLNELAAHDFNVIKELFDYDIQTLTAGMVRRAAVSGPHSQTTTRPMATAACSTRESGTRSWRWRWSWSGLRM